jgi:hypothetical protein
MLQITYKKIVLLFFHFQINVSFGDEFKEI